MTTQNSTTLPYATDHFRREAVSYCIAYNTVEDGKRLFHKRLTPEFPTKEEAFAAADKAEEKRNGVFLLESVDLLTVYAMQEANQP